MAARLKATNLHVHRNSHRTNHSHRTQQDPSILEQANLIREQAAQLKDSIIEEARTIYQFGEKTAKGAVDGLKDYTTDTTLELSKNINTYVKREPMRALAFAALVGAGLTLILRRRRK